MSLIEIIVALVLVAFIGTFTAWFINLFSWLPSIFIIFMSLFFGINIILFVIHRK